MVVMRMGQPPASYDEYLRREANWARSEDGRRRAEERKRRKERRWKWAAALGIPLLLLPGGFALLGVVVAFWALGYGWYLGGKVQPDPNQELRRLLRRF